MGSIEPIVFVGSSGRALIAARAVQANLQRDWNIARVRIWDKLPDVGKSILDSLLKDLAAYDFAVLIVTDDTGADGNARSGENVLIEFGLFAGNLGQEKVFLLVEEKVAGTLPSDLGGLIYRKFRMRNDWTEMLAELGPACGDIAAIVGRWTGASAKIDKLAKRVDAQASQIDTLIRYFVSASIFKHLWGIGLLRQYMYQHDGGNQREFYFLRDAGLIRPKSGGFLDFREGQPWNVAEVAEPTPIGWMFIKQRRDDIPVQLLRADPANLRVDPDTLE